MSVRKNGKAWAVSFYYNDWNGERVRHRKTGFPTKREAQEYERDFLANKSGTPKMSFGELSRLYLEDCKCRLRITTYVYRERMIRAKIDPFFEHTSLEDITPAMVRKWQTQLIGSPQNYAPTYLRLINSQLSAILNYAVKYYGLSSNPVKKCGPIGKKHAEAMQFWTAEEFLKFSADIPRGEPCEVIFHLLYWTGMRSGELFALTAEDFDFQTNTVSITKSCAMIDGKRIVQEPKTPKSRRTVTVPQRTMLLVQNYIDRIYDTKDGVMLFPQTRYYLNRTMRHVCKRAGVKRIRIHDLRHSHASLLIDLGYSPLLIAERLGHESIETTLQTYSHLYPNKQDELADRLDNLLKNGQFADNTQITIPKTKQKAAI